MTATTPPSPDEWKSLYAAAVEFRDIAPWQWMTDDMVFGVQHPETGETGYCSVLGALKQMFALNVYVGPSGLATYFDLALGRVASDSLDTMYCQKCLQVSFDDRSTLDQRDLGVIKQLGLKFKGNHQWPVFRDYTPGYLPWYIDSQQARFLPPILREAGSVALRLRANPGLLPKENGLFLVRVPNKAGNTFQWSDKIQRAESPAEPIHISAIPDEKIMNRVKRLLVARNAVWEIDLNYSPTVIQENPSQRPHYPKSLICISEKGMALGHHLFPHEVDPHEFQKRILSVFQKTNMVPARVKVKRKEVHDLLNPIASPLGVSLEMVDDLPLASNFFNDLFDFLNRV